MVTDMNFKGHGDKIIYIYISNEIFIEFLKIEESVKTRSRISVCISTTAIFSPSI
jgi:hypothetical protein